ncbi:MAG: amidohydrolase family protein, partial [Lachnospiraceae bacterium]|nr:amidohydrolase family protein [Lachnospiraceae bacterium]
MFDLLIVHADILTMCDDSPFISDGCIAVKDGKLAYVGSLSPAEPALRIIDATGKIALPGLVNAHTHGAMTMMRGYADDCPLQKWLTEKVFPVEARLPPQAVAASARVGFAEMIRTGTTSITDMYFHQTAVAQAVLETGLRASLGNALAGGGEFSAEDDSRVQDTRRLISEFHHAAGDLLRADVCVHSEYVSTPAIRRFAAELAAEHGLR